jgi:hypothetical protein
MVGASHAGSLPFSMDEVSQSKFLNRLDGIGGIITIEPIAWKSK